MKIDQLIATRPKLRFPSESKEWQRKTFSDLFSFHRTNSYSREDLSYLEGSVKNIHYGDIHTRFKSRFDIVAEEVPFLNLEIDVAKIEDDDYCKIGDVVMADASEDFADVGKVIEIVNLADEKVVAGLHTLLARPSDCTFAVGFLAYLFQSWKVRLQIMTYSQGAKVLGISRGWLNRISLDFPSRHEQVKIAAFLSAVDEKITALSRKKELLTKYKIGVRQQIFDQKIRFKDGNGNNFPDWEKKPLGKVCKVYDGTHMTPDYQESGIPFYSVEHVTANNFTETKFISEDVFEKENKRVRLEKGDILMTRIGDIGTSKYISWDVKASFYVSLALIKQSKLINSLFLNQYISSNDFQHELHKRTIHVAFPKKINLGEISNCEIVIPSQPEQERIAAFLTAIDSKIDLVNTQLEKSKTFKKGLLQQMFV